MRIQRNMPQMKEQNKTPQKNTNRMEPRNLLDVEFKTQAQVIRMLNKLRVRVHELSENFNKEIENIKMELETIKKNQSEIKDTLAEMKNAVSIGNQQWGR